MERTRPARFRATVHYDGTGFHGWQVQPRVRTVQGALEAALEELGGASSRVESAGRTDRGVHATGQEIAFGTVRDWEEADLFRALNAVLPDDVRASALVACPAEFHPRFDAVERRYEYLVAGPAGARPLRRERLWRPADEPDRAALDAAAASLPGRHSFEAYAKAGQPERGTDCRVRMARWERTLLGDLRFTVVANRFLHHMVRYLVTTMVEEGTGRRSPGETARLLEDPEAGSPPAPAPPEGLYLTGVRYPSGWNRPAGIPGIAPRETASGSGVGGESANSDHGPSEA